MEPTLRAAFKQLCILWEMQTMWDSLLGAPGVAEGLTSQPKQGYYLKPTNFVKSCVQVKCSNSSNFMLPCPIFV